MNFEGKRIILTGGCGFKGTHLYHMLRALGAEVFIFDRVADGTVSLAAPLTAAEGGDFDMIIHFAADTIVSSAQKTPEEAIENNISATLGVLKYARKYNTPVLIATTDKVYAVPHVKNTEEYPLGGHCPYSASKVAIEEIAKVYREVYDTFVVTVRCANCIGSYDKNDSRLIPDLINSYLSNTAPTIRNPSFTRPYVHVLDALWGYLLIADKMMERGTRKDWPFYDAINIGGYHATCEQIGIYFELITGAKVAYNKPQDFKEAQSLLLDGSYIEYAFSYTRLYPLHLAVLRAVRDELNDVPLKNLVVTYLQERGALCSKE